ncbi:hypothetical protein EVAR_95543_1 [Eumeta japonica]|uniref:Uncharacterized protein n=1 Tax=Eumeta variegata TaxID=151549 RepID=A0A4C1UJM2_EUMVA|nr:hypothetical protein EVAR_95543_1 [Eumeta japonica]
MHIRFLIAFSRGKRACKPPDSKRSPPPMNARNLRGMASVLSASWEGTGYLMENRRHSALIHRDLWIVNDRFRCYFFEIDIGQYGSNVRDWQLGVPSEARSKSFIVRIGANELAGHQRADDHSRPRTGDSRGSPYLSSLRTDYISRRTIDEVRSKRSHGALDGTNEVDVDRLPRSLVRRQPIDVDTTATVDPKAWRPRSTVSRREPLRSTAAYRGVINAGGRNSVITDRLQNQTLVLYIEIFHAFARISIELYEEGVRLRRRTRFGGSAVENT